ncbi:RNA 3'-terminal phosphate cyclase/enolpyruvate transferase [Nemania serpens]|nr:RNA 3'-terminal phosphate cyclase/enolpyruvate transferase [Nemania serpens]
MITIDGSTLEGGGGLVRSVLALSSILNKSIQIHSIREHRPDGRGLRPGHNTSVDAIGKLSAASVKGNVPSTSELEFVPHVSMDRLRAPLTSSMDIHLGGSASIFLIAVLPYLLFARLGSTTFSYNLAFDADSTFTLTLQAGMLCLSAPSYFYMRQVYLPVFRSIGITEENLSFTEDYKQGWQTDDLQVPGRMVVHLKPLSQPLNGFVLKSRGALQRIHVTAHVPKKFLEQFKRILQVEIEASIASEARQRLEVVIDTIESNAEGQYHLLMTATTSSPTSYLGYEQNYPKPCFPPEIEGNEQQIAYRLIRSCIRGLWKELSRGSAVDEHMEDILAIYQAMACGFSSVVAGGNEMPVPEFCLDYAALGPKGAEYDLDIHNIHRETSWWIIQQLAGVRFEEQKDNQGRSCHGCIGLGLGHSA